MSTHENELAADFLLGRLSEDERASFEESFVVDEASYKALLQTESELIDDLVSGRMTGEDRKRFVASVAVNQRLRAKVQFSRALMRYSLARSSSAPAQTFRTRLSSLLAFHPAFAATAAAVLLLIICGLWLLTGPQEPDLRASMETPEINAPIISGSPKSTSIPQEVGHVKDLQKSKASSASDVPALTPRVRQSSSPADVPTSEPKRSSVPAIVSTIILRPGLTRGSQEQVSAANKKRAGSLRLQMEVPADAGEFKQYAIIVETVAGEQVWNRKVGKKSGSLSTLVPNRLLQRGEYIVTLKGIAANGAADTLNEYTFNVR